eukprot:2990957-Rhodomonas_salina.3
MPLRVPYAMSATEKRYARTAVAWFSLIACCFTPLCIIAVHVMCVQLARGHVTLTRWSRRMDFLVASH